MNFLIDAQLPRGLATLLVSQGHDAIHTLDLPEQNRTSDEILCLLAAREQRVLISKDNDFANSFFVSRRPPKLLMITTGDLSNHLLLAIFRTHIDLIVKNLSEHSFIEIDREGLTIRD